MGEERRHLITVGIPVRWSDQDVNRHVNNATYFTYFEQTRIEWLKRQRAVTHAKGEGVVVAQASCDYLQPIPYPETLEIRMYAGRVGRTSFTTLYEIFGEDRATKYATGQAVLVWVNRKEGKSQPFPDELRATLTQ